MVSLQRYQSGGKSYWRLVESVRVNGKPRPKLVMHLGTPEALLNKLLRASEGRLRVQSFQHGDIAALKAAADRLGVESILENHLADVPKCKRRHKLSIARTLLLAAFNRAIRPCSKRAWAKWAATTSLHRLFPRLKVESLTSQLFWDQMDCIEIDTLRKMEGELTKVIVDELKIKLDTLFYDATNFFTFIDSTNKRCELPQRGKSKEKRSDLRIFSLALLVARDGQIPLCSHVYEGNRVDSKSFPDSLTLIRERLASLSISLQDVTLVYDKGNNSRENQANVDSSSIGYVASLSPAHHDKLAKIPVRDYVPIPEGNRLEGIPVLRLTRKIWGAKRTLLLFISEQLRSGQIRGLEQHLSKRLKELAEWKEQLAKPRSGPRSVESANNRIQKLVSGQFIKQVLRVSYHPDRKGAERLEYSIDQDARSKLETEFFGKRILMTNRSKWSDEEILLAYRGQSDVEAVFRQLKDDEHLAVRPQHHWTDQKIHVHTFMCLLALLLSRVVEHGARKHGREEGLSGILDLLARVRLAMVITPSGQKGGRPRVEWQLEDGNGEALDLFRQLVPATPPFVYTDGRG